MDSAARACAPGAADPVAEARWIQGEAERQRFPQAFIAAVDLTSPSLGDLLAVYRRLPVVRAVRQPLYWADDPLRRPWGAAGLPRRRGDALKPAQPGDRG